MKLMKCLHCSVRLKKTNSHAIFDTTGIELQLDKLLEKHFGIAVLENTNPLAEQQVLCEDCVNQLIDLFDLSEREREQSDNVHSEERILNHPSITKNDSNEQQPPIVDEFEFPIIEDEHDSLPNTEDEEEEASLAECIEEENVATKGTKSDSFPAYKATKNSQGDSNVVDNIVAQVNDNETYSEEQNLKEFNLTTRDSTDCDEQVQCLDDVEDIDVGEYLSKVINTDLEEITYEQNTQCNLCSEVLTTHDAVILHAANDHQDEKQQFSCIVCNSSEKFRTTKQYSVHLVIKHYELTTLSIYCVCPECNKRFSDFIEFNKHSCCVKISHTKAILECQVCLKEFPSSKRLRFHMQFHRERRRPKVCFYCDKFFRDDEELFVHIMYSHDPENIFVCKKCDRVCSNEDNYQAHVKLHDAVRQFSCDLCPKKYMYKQLLNYHKESCHSFNDLYKCELCHKMLASKSVLKKHMNLHIVDTDATVRVCSECGLIGESEEDTQKHISKETSCNEAIFEEKTLKIALACEHCEMAYTSVQQLKAHRSTAHPKEEYLCRLCHQSYDEYKKLKTHMLTHKDYEPLQTTFPVNRYYVCNVGSCEQIYIMWTSLGNHKRSKHDREIQLTCKPCNQQFETKWQLNSHLEKGHVDVEFQCQFCSKIFPTQMSLSVHVARKHNNNHKTCLVCKATYKDDAALQEHTDLMHVKVNCELCNKLVKNKRNLEVHVRMIHNNIKRFFCEVCKKGYYNKNDLLGHEKTAHKQVKPFKCDKCTFSTSYEKSLETHMAMHNNNFPFQCPICSREFTRKSCMTLHMRRHENKKPFVCSDTISNGCKAAFVSRGILNKHIREKHSCDNNEMTTTTDDPSTTKRRKRMSRTVKHIEYLHGFNDDDDDDDYDSKEYIVLADGSVDNALDTNLIVFKEEEYEIADDKINVFQESENDGNIVVNFDIDQITQNYKDAGES